MGWLGVTGRAQDDLPQYTHKHPNTTHPTSNQSQAAAEMRAVAPVRGLARHAGRRLRPPAGAVRLARQHLGLGVERGVGGVGEGVVVD